MPASVFLTQAMHWKSAHSKALRTALVSKSRYSEYRRYFGCWFGAKRPLSSAYIIMGCTRAGHRSAPREIESPSCVRYMSRHHAVGNLRYYSVDGFRGVQIHSRHHITVLYRTVYIVELHVVVTPAVQQSLRLPHGNASLLHRMARLGMGSFK